MSEVKAPGFAVSEGGSASLEGSLTFSTVGGLLPRGIETINSRRVTCIDLSAVTGADSAGLALLIEWLSVAKAAGQPLRYDKIPSQLLQLAKLSEVDGLLEGRAT